MSPSLFTGAILRGEPIDIFNQGKMQRDFTYIDDIVEGVPKVFDGPPKADENGPAYRFYNIGNDQPERLGHFVETLEKSLGVEAKKEMYPMQPGDVQSTHADLTAIKRDFYFQPTTSFAEGLDKFVNWYREYYQR